MAGLSKWQAVMNKTLISAVLAVLMSQTGSEALADSSKQRSGSSNTGLASYYHDRFQGQRTASGARYNMHAFSAAHRTLPLGSLVRVTNPRSGNSVVVRINDRGPHARGRVIDLSRAAAREIGLKGVAQVQLDVLRTSSRSAS